MGKRVLQATMESNDEGSEDYISEFCFMAIDEGKEGDYERASEEL